MTFKKYNKSGQSIFEYFILTLIVVAVMLTLGQNKIFQDIKNSTNTSFNNAVDNITNIPSSLGP
jgi:hypothetical protein